MCQGQTTAETSLSKDETELLSKASLPRPSPNHVDAWTPEVQGIVPNPAPVSNPNGKQYAKVNPFAAADHGPFVNVFTPDPTSEASSSGKSYVPKLNRI
ncbi:hypothetical protein Tco_1048443 [Tanacetum coccineum]